jgi:hypothetical protein
MGVTMRPAIWLVVLCVSCQVAQRVAAAEGGAPDPVTGVAPTVIDPRLWDAMRQQVTVRVYSSTRIDSKAQRAALDVAAAAFRAASVEVVWAICDDGVCGTRLAETDLAVRMVAAGDTRPGLRPLGEALIDPDKRRGVLATAFVDRTLRLSRELAIDHARLLGRTVAHEIGHLLLASTSHGTGLMREVWSRDELLRTRQDDWVLHPSDAQAIRQRLRGVRS